MTFEEYLSMLPDYLASHTVPELIGAPGIGKTQVQRQGAAMMSRLLGRPFGFTQHVVSTFEAPDLRGYLIPTKEHGELVAQWTKPGWYPTVNNTEVFVDGQPVEDWQGGVPEDGMLFFDEFRQASSDLQKGLSPIILDKGYGDHRLPRGWGIVLASNRVSDRAGVQRLLSMLQNRVMEIHVSVPLDDWRKHAMQVGVHPLIVAFTRAVDAPFASEVPAEPSPYCTPRSLVMVDRLLQAAAKRKGLPENHLPYDGVTMEAVAGLIGAAQQNKLGVHLKSGTELVPVAEILDSQNPRDMRKPAPHLMMMQATLLAAQATMETASVFMRYLSGDKVGYDPQMLFVHTLEQRKASFLLSPDVAAWVRANPRYKSQYTRV